MAKTFTAASGIWNLASNWAENGVPGTGEVITINANCVCTVDITTAVVGVVTIADGGSLILAGDLSCAGILVGTNSSVNMPYTTANGSYILNCSGRISFKSGGKFLVGDASNPLPLGVNFEIHFTTTIGKFGTQTGYTNLTNTVNIYGSPLTVCHAEIKTAAVNHQYTISVDSTSISDTWKTYFDGLHATGKARAYINVSNYATKANALIATTEYLIASIASASGAQVQITISNNSLGTHPEGFDGAKPLLGYVAFETRNVKITADDANVTILFDSNVSQIVNYCEFRGYNRDTTTVFTVSSLCSITGCSICNCNMTFSGSTGKNTITSTLFANNYYNNSNVMGNYYLSCVFINNVYGAQNAYYCKFSNCIMIAQGSGAINQSFGCTISGCTFTGNGYGLSLVGYISGSGVTFTGNGYGAANSVLYLTSSTFANQANYDLIYIPRAILHDSSLSTVYNIIALIADSNLNYYVCSYNHNATTGDIKAWSPGGNVYYDADASVYFGTTSAAGNEVTNYGRVFLVTLTTAALYTFYEQEFTLKPGQKLELYTRMQKEATSGTSKVELQLKGSDSFMYATGSPLVTNTIAANTTLQFVAQEYYNSDTKPVTIVARWMHLDASVSATTLKFNYDYIVRG